ncbi:hypothetical protein UT300005_10190 [Clostridium sp. CTA-5]
MRLKKIAILTMLFMFIFFNNVKAIDIGPTSASYKEGVYKITNANKFTLIAKLITPDTNTSFAIVDSKGNQKIFRRFNKPYVPTSEIILEENDFIVIIGSGEISLVFSK